MADRVGFEPTVRWVSPVNRRLLGKINVIDVIDVIDVASFVARVSGNLRLIAIRTHSKLTGLPAMGEGPPWRRMLHVENTARNLPAAEPATN